MKLRNYIYKSEYTNSKVRQIELLFVIVFVIPFLFISNAHATSDFIEINVSSASQVKPGGTLNIWVTVSNLNIENKTIIFDVVEFENPFEKVNKKEAKVDKKDNKKEAQVSKKEAKQIGKTLIAAGGAKREKDELKHEFFSRGKTKNLTSSDMKIYADKEKQIKKKISQGVKTERIDITVPKDIREGQTFSIPVNVLLSESSAESTQSLTTQSVEQQITFTVTSNPEPRRAVLIIVDGARADKLYQVATNNPNGNFSWMINNGVKFVNAVNVFPTITVVNHPSILTGASPDRHGIASAGFFNKNTHEYTDYYSLIDSYIFNEINDDLQVNTIYEDMPASMISRVFTEFVKRGSDTSDQSWSAYLDWSRCKDRTDIAYCKAGDANVIDDIIDNTIWPDNRNFNLTVIWLAGNDIWSHSQSPDSTTVVLNNVDIQIGRLKDFYGQAIVDETIFVVTSDHGQTGVNSNRNIDSNQLANVLEGNGYYKNALGINIMHDYYVGGDGGGSEEIYIQGNLVLNDNSSFDGTWSALPRLQDIQPAAHAFYTQAYVDTVLVRYQNSNGYRVYKEYADGTPYILSLVDYFNGRSEYADAVNRFSKLDSERSGDLILLANYSGGYYFESHSYLGDHGNLNPNDSYVPLIISGPGIRHDTLTSARTIDIAPTIANLLGFAMPNSDGSLLPIQYLSLPGSINGFVRDGEYFQTTVDVGDIPKLGLSLSWVPNNNNNLDLKVISPSGKVYGTGGISEKDGFTHIKSCVGDLCWADEMTFNEPETGRWIVRVIGTSISPSQWPPFITYQSFSLKSSRLPPEEPPGGINFTSAHLNYVSYCSAEDGRLSFVMKGEEADVGDPIIDMGKRNGDAMNAFLTGLVIPNYDQFISMDPPDPYVWSAEKGRVRMDTSFANTWAGLAFLDADVKLKQIFVSPEMKRALEESYNEWDRMIQGTSYYGKLTSYNWYYPSPLMRAWITPDNVTASGENCQVFITNATMGVDFEVDAVYFDYSQYGLTQSETEEIKDKLGIWKQYFKNKVYQHAIPVQVNRINNADEFENLRTVYVSLSIAQWYKTLDRNKIPFGDIIDTRNIEGLQAEEPFDLEYWKDKAWDPLGSLTFSTPSGTFSVNFRGGVVLSGAAPLLEANLSHDQKKIVEDATNMSYAKVENDYYYGGTVAPNLPDIAPTLLFTIPEEPSADEEAIIVVGIRNQGKEDAGEFKVKFYDQYTDQDGNTVTIPIGESSEIGLQSGAFNTTSIQWNPEFRLGKHLIKADVDYNNAVEETSDQNNMLMEEVLVVSSVPIAKIISPETGTSFLRDDEIILQSYAFDYQDGSIPDSSLVWVSNLDGELGRGKVIKRTFSLGEHIIALKATDSDGNTVEDQISIAVNPSAVPIVTIETPLEGQVSPQGETVYLQGTAFDSEDGRLPEESITWISSIDGMIGTGSSISVSNLSVGNHIITLEALDSTGVKGSTEVNVTIEYGIPFASISSPSEGKEFFFHKKVDLNGSATDPQDGILTEKSLRWNSDLDGFLGTGSFLNISNLTIGYHIITLTATDSHGLVNTDQVRIKIHPPYSPTASIISPANGTTSSYGEPLYFEGKVSDTEDGILSGGSVEWSSDIDGSLGIGTSFERSGLSVGIHRINLTATDSMGLRNSLVVSVTVNPTGVIIAPIDGAIYSQQDSISLMGDVLGIPEGVFTWSSSIDGILGIGKNISVSGLSPGTHTITLTVKRADGLRGNASVNVIVVGKSSVFIDKLSDGFTNKNLSFVAFSNKTTILVDSLSDTSTTKDLEFNGSEDKIVYLKLPKYARVKYSNIEIHGLNKNHGSLDFTEDFTTSTYKDDATTAKWGDGVLVARFGRIDKDVIKNWEFNNNMESWTGDYNGVGDVAAGGKSPDATNYASWGWKFKTLYVGSWSRIYQSNVDLSKVKKIEFKYLWGGDSLTITNTMGFWVDGTRLWSYAPDRSWPSNDPRRLRYGELITVDVSSYPGQHTLSFRSDIEGPGGWYWYWTDGGTYWWTSAVDSVRAYSVMSTLKSRIKSG